MMKFTAYLTSFLNHGIVKRRHQCSGSNFGGIFAVCANIVMCAVLLAPTTSYAQVDVPDWLHPSWIYEKVMGFHNSNAERFEQAQAKAAAKAAADAKNPPQKPAPNLAPVVTAVPKLNEKYLSPEELKELRKQLKNQK
jgi:hypothetical protein